MTLHITQAGGGPMGVGDAEQRAASRTRGAHAIAAASAAMLVGARGEMLELDAGAASALAHGCALHLVAGRVHAREPAADQLLQAAIAAAATSSVLAETIVHLSDATRLQRSRWRVTPRRGGAGAMLLLLPDVAEPPRDAQARLAAHHGFTPAEAACALLLTQGLGIDQVAARQGVSRNTVRAHLRSLYAKTGTHRQVALVAIVNRALGNGAADAAAS